MTQDEMNEAMGARHGFHMQSVLGESAALAIGLRAQLDVAQMAQGDLQKELADTKALLAAAEKQVEDSGAEIERLKSLTPLEHPTSVEAGGSGEPLTV